MQKTIYTCDDCGKPIGDKPHISMQAQKALTGIAMPPGYIDTSRVGGPMVEMPHARWQVKSIPSGFMHFCNPPCLANYFRKMYEKVVSLKTRSARSKVAEKKKGHR